ncbi:serine/threonine protein kinase 15, partial [Tribonema minus]
MSLISSHNPYVVKLYFAFRSKEFLYLVLEYVNGGDCSSMLRAVTRLNPAAARFYTAEATLAIEFLHNHGIVHRDLKPDNLMLTREGHIKIVDFGLSRRATTTADQSKSQLAFERAVRRRSRRLGWQRGGGDRSSSSSSSGDDGEREDGLAFRPIKRGDKLYSPVGTSRYVAPEVILSVGHDHRVDWWSLGVLLFEFLVGHTPFDADEMDEIYNNILSGNIAWPEEDMIPDDAKDLIKRLLTTNPHTRLGRDGAAQVKAHPFFQGVDWDTLYLQQSPFVPQLASEEDTSYFNHRAA